MTCMLLIMNTRQKVLPNCLIKLRNNNNKVRGNNIKANWKTNTSTWGLSREGTLHQIMELNTGQN